jgi:hypothetical protein
VTLEDCRFVTVALDLYPVATIQSTLAKFSAQVRVTVIDVAADHGVRMRLDALPGSPATAIDELLADMLAQAARVHLGWFENSRLRGI